jgi:hypothetical protein
MRGRALRGTHDAWRTRWQTGVGAKPNSGRVGIALGFRYSLSTLYHRSAGLAECDAARPQDIAAAANILLVKAR